MDGIALPRANAAAFATARRHSARVRFLRRAIPAGCTVALAITIAWTLLNPFAGSDASFSVGPVNLSGTKVTMELPKLTGFKKDAKSYEVAARALTQDIRRPNVGELTEIDARIEMEPKTFARLRAGFGVFDSTTEKGRLSKGILFTTDDGTELVTEAADVDFKSGDIVSTTPVTVQTRQGSIEADGFSIRENAKVMIFEGRVRSIINQPEPPADQAQRTTE